MVLKMKLEVLNLDPQNSTDWSNYSAVYCTAVQRGLMFSIAFASIVSHAWNFFLHETSDLSVR